MSENHPDSVSTPPSSGTSLSLLQRVRANDSTGWQRLVQLYSPLVFYWCKRAGLGREDAADVMQNVWHAVAGHIAQFEHRGGAFRGWLWTIARHKIADHFRKLVAQPVAAGGSEALEFMHALPEQEPESYIAESSADGSGDLLRQTLDLVRTDFETNTWQAFWLAAVDGLSAREIGSKLGMSLDAVYQAKARVLRRLREELVDLGDDIHWKSLGQVEEPNCVRPPRS